MVDSAWEMTPYVVHGLPYVHMCVHMHLQPQAHIYTQKKINVLIGEMVLAENPGLVPRTHISAHNYL